MIVLSAAWLTQVAEFKISSFICRFSPCFR